MTVQEPDEMTEMLDIMILDDSAEEAAAIRRKLRSVSPGTYNVRASQSAEEVLKICREHPPDCLLLDLRMPELDGLGFLDRLIRERGVDFPIVVLTAYGDEGFAARALRLGAQDYLLKDQTSPELLRRAIEHARERFRIGRELALSNARLSEANANLRDTIEKLQAIFSQKAVGIAQADGDGRFSLVNDAFCELTGRTREELSGLRLRDIAAPAEEGLYPGETEVEKQYRRRDGSLIWVHESVALIHDAQGEPVAQVILARDITERRNAREARALLASIVEASADAIVYQDLDGIIRTWNHGAERTYGYSAAEVIGESFEILLLVNKAQEWKAMRENALAGNNVQGAETIRIRKDGYRVAVAVTFSAVRNSAGQVMGFSSIDRDISEKRRAQEALSKSEARYRLLADAMPQIVFGINSSGETRFANQRWAEYTGAPADESVDLDWVACLHPEDRDRTLALWREAIGKGSAFETETRLLRADHEYRWHLFRAVPLTNVEGQAGGWIGTATDIQQRKVAEAELQESRERLGLALNAARMGIWDWDIPGARIVCSEEIAPFFGRPQRPFEFDLEAFLGAVHPVDRETVKTCLEAATRQSASYSVEFRLVQPDGTVHWIESQGIVVRGRSGEALRMVGAARNIDEKKTLEQKLAASEKYESIGVLAAGLAHDFNNLLVGVIGSASLARELLSPGHEAATLLDDVVKAGERAASLTAQMLAYSGKGQSRSDSTDVAKLAGVAAAGLQANVRSGVEVKMALEPGCIVSGDPDHIRQVIDNLLTNAIESLEQGPGTVSVSVRTQDVDEGYINHMLRNADIAPGKFVRIEVRDTGHGIDESIRHKIFEPFFSTKFAGRGLGLAAAAGIVRVHKGAIHVDSTTAAGTTVAVLLPALPPSNPVGPVPVFHGSRNSASKILVVDDEEMVATLAARILSTRGYEPLIASSGAAALDLIQKHTPEISAVVLDLTMPGMSGGETLRRIRLVNSDIPVILSSGYSEQHALSEVARQDIAGFLQKPYTPNRLLEEIAGVVTRQA
jgi:two-component system cell cycle sensor histidine kinase/response regulator CckA